MSPLSGVSPPAHNTTGWWPKLSSWRLWGHALQNPSCNLVLSFEKYHCFCGPIPSFLSDFVPVAMCPAPRDEFQLANCLAYPVAHCPLQLGVDFTWYPGKAGQKGVRRGALGEPYHQHPLVFLLLWHLDTMARVFCGQDGALKRMAEPLVLGQHYKPDFLFYEKIISLCWHYCGQIATCRWAQS